MMQAWRASQQRREHDVLVARPRRSQQSAEQVGRVIAS